MAEKKTYEQRLAQLPYMSGADLAGLILPAVILSMRSTAPDSSWTHDDYDVAHAALAELRRRADKPNA